MKNTVGKAVKGENFYNRKSIINEINESLEQGQNIYLSGERFSGKTSILQYFNSLEESNFEFVYVNLSDLEDGSEYFKFITKSVFKSQAVDSFLDIPKEGLGKVGGVLGKFAKASGLPFKFEVSKMFKTFADSSAEAFKEFYTELGGKFTSFNIVLLVDGFPDAVRNIEKESGAFTAAKFLQTASVLRASALKNVTFVYSGSLGLAEIAEKLDVEGTLSDLKEINIPVLGEEVGLEFITRLFNKYELSYKIQTISYLFEKIDHLNPFHLQLMVRELRKLTEDQKSKMITNELIDEAFQNIFKKKNLKHFESYFKGLKRNLDKKEFLFAKDLLEQLAKDNEVSLSGVSSLSEKHELSKRKEALTLKTLEYDGYINYEKGVFYFNSPVLSKAWSKFFTD